MSRPPVEEPISARQSDRLCRKASGTTMAAYRAGLLRGNLAKGRGPTRTTLWVLPSEALMVLCPMRLCGARSTRDANGKRRRATVGGAA